MARMDGTTTVDRREDCYVLLDGDEEVVVLAFEPVDEGVVALTHTVTREDRQGEGLAGRLVGAVLDDLRERGLHLRPDCAYVASYLEEHPDQQELIAR